MRSAAALIGGTVLARAITIGVSPVLTRLYTPAEFGSFAVFLALASAISPIVCGRYEITIVLPREDDKALRLLGLSIRIAFIVAFVALVAIFVAQFAPLPRLRTDRLGRSVYFIALALLATGVNTAMGYYAIRRGDFRVVATGQFVNAATAAAVNVGLGVAGAGWVGLLAGWMTGAFGNFIYLACRYRNVLPRHFLAWDAEKRELLSRYREYPQFSASFGLLDGVRSAIPTFALGQFFPIAIAGYYSLAARTVNMPLGMIASSISQVNLKKVADLVNSGQDVRPYLVRITIALLVLVGLPALVLMLTAPDLFALVFGREWRVAGNYLRILMPSFAVQCIVSTVSTTISATENNRLGALWKVVAFVVASTVVFSVAPRSEVRVLLIVIVVTDVLMYAFYYSLIWRAAANPGRLSRAA